MIEWILSNKEWVFSGIGLSVIPLFITILKKGSRRKESTVQNNILLTNEIVNNIEDKNEIQYNVYEVVDRFVEVYKAHDVSLNQIHSFVDKKFNLKISDFKSKDTILDILTEELLEYTCEIFRIRRSWLDGTCDYIYDTKRYYKNVHSFLEC